MKNVGKFLVLAIMIISVAGCGATPTLKDGGEAVATLKDGGVSADSMYAKLKTKYGAAEFMDLIDTEILNKMYKEDAAEKEYLDNQIKDLKTSAKENKMEVADLLAYYGFENIKQAKEAIKLSYRRTLAVNDYLKDNLRDKEIKNYYEDEVYGDIKVKHILIAPDTTDEMSSEEKTAAEKQAKKEAEKIIKKLQKGEDFSKLAKKYSDDSSNAKKGGDLGWVKTGDMVPEFNDAAFNLKKGKYTTAPVKTTYGYHIIYKVDEKAKPKFDKVKNSIKDSVVKDKLAKDQTLTITTLDKIRDEAGLKFKDKELKKLYKKAIQQQLNQANAQKQNAQ